ncbi:MAG TPA: hypothetical protein VFS43_13435 [Polyangiaceae bacterium]|nr:hypothetical protein [Polyangiaceae bacterium]
MGVPRFTRADGGRKGRAFASFSGAGAALAARLWRGPSALAAAAMAASGCAAVLGIDEVNQDDDDVTAGSAGQGGGGGSSTGGGGRAGRSGSPTGGSGTGGSGSGTGGSGTGGSGTGGSGTGGSGTGGTGTGGSGTGGSGTGGDGTGGDGTGGSGTGGSGTGGTGTGGSGTGGSGGGGPDHIVINEIFHNPPGADPGKCFIELYGPPNASLDGLEIRFFRGNSSDAFPIFLFGPQHALGESGLFVLAEPGVMAPGGVPIAFDGDDPNGMGGTSPNLFNSANSIGLMKGDSFLDAVAYSDSTLAAACPQVTEGEGGPDDCAESPLASDPFPSSISRDGAGTDTDNNVADFRLLAPTPGRPNQPPL